MKSDRTTNSAWDIFSADARVYDPDSDLHTILAQMAGLVALYSKDELNEIKKSKKY